MWHQQRWFTVSNQNWKQKEKKKRVRVVSKLRSNVCWGSTSDSIRQYQTAGRVTAYQQQQQQPHIITTSTLLQDVSIACNAEPCISYSRVVRPCVVDFGSNRKRRVCDFLLVINGNLGPILPVSEILQVFC